MVNQPRLLNGSWFETSCQAWWLKLEHTFQVVFAWLNCVQAELWKCHFLRLEVPQTAFSTHNKFCITFLTGICISRIKNFAYICSQYSGGNGRGDESHYCIYGQHYPQPEHRTNPIEFVCTWFTCSYQDHLMSLDFCFSNTRHSRTRRLLPSNRIELRLFFSP